MSSPTPGPDQQPWGPPPGATGPQGGAPQYGPQQGAPQYGTPPYGAPQYGTPQYGAPGYGNAPAPGSWGDPPARRPGSVTAAAVVAIVVGALVGLLNVIGLLAAGTLDVDLTAVDVALSVVIIALAAALLTGGIRVLTGRAPTLLLYAGYGLIGLWVVNVVVNLAQGLNPFGGILTVVAGGLVVGLLRNPASRAWFASRGQAG